MKKIPPQFWDFYFQTRFIFCVLQVWQTWYAGLKNHTTEAFLYWFRKQSFSLLQLESEMNFFHVARKTYLAEQDFEAPPLQVALLGLKKLLAQCYIRIPKSFGATLEFSVAQHCFRNCSPLQILAYNGRNRIFIALASCVALLHLLKSSEWKCFLSRRTFQKSVDTAYRNLSKCAVEKIHPMQTFRRRISSFQDCLTSSLKAVPIVCTSICRHLETKINDKCSSHCHNLSLSISQTLFPVKNIRLM